MNLTILKRIISIYLYPLCLAAFVLPSVSWSGVVGDGATKSGNMALFDLLWPTLLLVLLLLLLSMAVKKSAWLKWAKVQEDFRVVNSLALGIREKIMVVQIGNKQLVLAVTPGRIGMLTTLEGEDQLCARTAKEQHFSESLRKIIQGQSRV